MPSFISSFNSKINNWWLTWLLSAWLLLLSIGWYESLLSSKGFMPSIEVNQDLWSWNRRQAGDQSNAIVLVGASRIQLGLDTKVLRSELVDKEIVPLAINGQYPMATIKGLAADETFNGLVLMSFMAQMLEPQYEEMQAEYNQYYTQKSSWYRSFDAYLTAHIKFQFRFLHPLLGLNDLVNYFSAKKKFPDPFYVSIYPDTSAAGDYSLVDVEPLKQYFIDDKKINYQAFSIMDKDTWLSQLDKLSKYIQTIRARGGEVVLLRFPTDDIHWLLDETYYPRAEFWDVMLDTIPQIKAIHFKDDEVLNSFNLPDSSHLDQADTKSFTMHIISMLKQLQLIE